MERVHNSPTTGTAGFVGLNSCWIARLLLVLQDVICGIGMPILRVRNDALVRIKIEILMRWRAMWWVEVTWLASR